MQLKDVTPIIKAILEERDKIPRTIDKERYIPNPQPYHDGNLIRGGIRKALRIIEQAPVVDDMPRWISVEERLPDIDAEVLIYKDEGLYDVAQYSGGERFWTLERNPDCWVTALSVTHWMHLPEPPKEESTC